MKARLFYLHFCNNLSNDQAYTNTVALTVFYRNVIDTSSPHKDRLSDLKIIDNLLKTYDRRATPTNKFGKPTQVGCELFIRSFGSISEKTMVRCRFLDVVVVVDVVATDALHLIFQFHLRKTMVRSLFVDVVVATDTLHSILWFHQ